MQNNCRFLKKGNTMKTTTIAGLLVFAAIVIGSIVCGGNITAYINLPSIVIVIGAPAGLALIKYKKGDNTICFIRNFKRYVIHIGVLGCVIGFIQMGSSLSEMKWYPQGSAVALLTVLYGITIYCVLDAFSSQAKT